MAAAGVAPPSGLVMPDEERMATEEVDKLMGETKFFDDLEREEEFEPVKVIPPSKTVLETDLFAAIQGEDLMKLDWAKQNRLDRHTCTDLFTSLYEPHLFFAGNPEDKIRSAWMNALVKNHEFQQIRASTTLDFGITDIAAHHLSKQYTAWVMSLTDEEKADLQNGTTTFKDKAKMHQSTSGAASGAADDVEEGMAAAAGLGMGEDRNRLDGKRISNLFRTLRKNPLLKGILAKAGKYRNKASGIQRAKTIHGVDDMVGITLGSSIPNLVPIERMKLSHHKLKLEARARLMEGQAMNRHYRATVKEAKGPIVVVVDESGSMSGEPHENAKAFALTMGWIAKSTNRWIGFVGFSGGSEGTRIAFPPGKWDQDKLTTWLCHFYGGGTDLDVPLEQLPNTYMKELNAPKGKTDIILITDAVVHAPDTMVKKFNDWKKEEDAKCYGIIIGAEPGDLSKVCEKTWTIDKFDIDAAPVDALFAL